MMATRKPTAGTLTPILRFARRNDLDGRYGWDWHVPGTPHESPKVYRTYLMACWSAWRWARAARRAGQAEIVGLGEPLTTGGAGDAGEELAA